MKSGEGLSVGRSGHRGQSRLIGTQDLRRLRAREKISDRGTADRERTLKLTLLAKEDDSFREGCRVWKSRLVCGFSGIPEGAHGRSPNAFSNIAFATRVVNSWMSWTQVSRSARGLSISSSSAESVRNEPTLSTPTMS